MHLDCDFSNSPQIQIHVNHLHAKMVENAAQKKENGNVIAYQNSLVQRVRMKEIHVRKFHIIHVWMEEHVFQHQMMPYHVLVLQGFKGPCVMKKYMKKRKKKQMSIKVVVTFSSYIFSFLFTLNIVYLLSFKTHLSI